MIPVRDDRSAEELRVLARAAATGRETLRLIAIAAILDGRGRRESAGLAGLFPEFDALDPLVLLQKTGQRNAAQARAQNADLHNCSLEKTGFIRRGVRGLFPHPAPRGLE